MEITRRCRVTGREFIVAEAEQELLRKIGEFNPVLCGEALPLPTVHPHENLQQIFSWGSIRYLFRVKSAVSGEPLLTRYDPDFGLKVCTQEEFFGEVDNREAGMPYDFSRGFFEQWFELMRRVIHPPLNRSNCENSDYTNGAINLKDCYLCFATFDSRDCMYCMSCSRCTDCIDLVSCLGCELCYSSCDLVRCYQVQHSMECKDCQDLFGCFDCRSCRSCFGCIGLERKDFHIYNQSVSEERFRSFIAEQQLHRFTAREEAIAELRQFVAESNWQPTRIVNCTRSTGAYLENCEDIVDCRSCFECKSCGYLIYGRDDYFGYRGAGKNSEFFYQSNSYNAQVNAYCYTLFGGRNDLYCASMYNSCSDCFGCIALNKQDYCVLNRQYSKAEYLELVPRIISAMKASGEWGEWYPPASSWHYYQESGVYDFLKTLPIEEARRRGYRIKDDEASKPAPDAVSANTLSEELSEIEAAFLVRTPVICMRSGRPFNLQRRELDFARRFGIPAPRLHWRERMQDLIDLRDLFPPA